MNGWIAVDLDGTLAEYNGWPKDGSIGQPIPAMIQRVRLWLADGKDVRIFTARVWPSGTNAIESVDVKRLTEATEQVVRIRAWCFAHIGQILPITCVKDFGMIECWDDRAVQVERNTGRRMDGGA